MPVHAKYLFGKYIDTSFAILLGTISYFVYEKKINRPKDQQLLTLLKDRFSEHKVIKNVSQER